jgi:hypothetical protein
MLALSVWGCVAARPPVVAPEPTPVPPASAAYRVALVGDFDYSPEELLISPRLVAGIREADVAFTIHVGDTKGGSAECTDEVAAATQRQLATFAPAAVLLFGDNDWTDCHRILRTKPDSPFGDPLERLGDLRRRYWSQPVSQGVQPMPVTRQADVDPAHAAYVENVRWARGPVVFVGLNVPGSNNGADLPDAAARTAAAVAWIRDGFREARDTGARAVVVAMQADPIFEDLPNPAVAGYRDVVTALQAETKAFAGEVVLVHGDTHQSRIDHPLFDAADPYACNTWRCGAQPLTRFTRALTWGSPTLTHWLVMTVDPDAAALFSFAWVPVR